MVSEQPTLELRDNEFAAMMRRIAQGAAKLATTALSAYFVVSRVRDGEYWEPDPYATEMPFVTGRWPR